MNTLRKVIPNIQKQQSLYILFAKRGYVSEQKQKLAHDITNIRDENKELREDNDSERLRQKEIKFRGKDERGMEPEKEQNKSANPFTTKGGGPDQDREAEISRIMRGEPQQNK